MASPRFGPKPFSHLYLYSLPWWSHQIPWLWVQFMLTLSFFPLALISTFIPKPPMGCLIVLLIRHIQHILPLLHPLPSVPHPVNSTTNYIFQFFRSENLASSLTPPYFAPLTSNPSPNPTDFISKINFPSVYFYLLFLSLVCHSRFLTGFLLLPLTSYDILASYDIFSIST